MLDGHHLGSCSLPSTKSGIPHFNDHICWVYDFGNGAVLKSDIELAMKDDSFHCFFCHIESGQWGLIAMFLMRLQVRDQGEIKLMPKYCQ